ncbi:restriction endonuclease subunit S [Variovorax sp. ZT4R33]|uniref:restriction endonuclease subunit S n=1 Tax=Variovorax sp. ZT4R33 TaxID=3443743 RepID=UPI003F458172
MSSEWFETTIGEQATLQRGFDITKAAQRAGSVPVVSSAGISSRHDTAMVKGPGVVLGRKGVVGSVHYISEDYWPHDTTLWVKNFHGNDELFVYYFFLAHARDLSALDVGSANPTLNRNHVHPIPTRWPPLREQIEVGGFLGTLDDRIALLRETNTTLEAIAQALFKSWFVDFDPVRAKQQGIALAGMDEATAALFPNSFEESELGLVPQGWTVGTLQDLLVLQRGFDLPSQNRIPGAYPIIAASGPSGTHVVPMAKGPGVVTGRSGLLGRVFLELEDHWPLNTTLWVKDFRAATPCYAYEVLRRLDFGAFNAGSAVPTLNRNHVHSLKYLIPSRSCVVAYEALAIQFHQKVRLNLKQADTLSILRETLLPRLISGQLRILDAEAPIQ